MEKEKVKWAEVCFVDTNLERSLLSLFYFCVIKIMKIIRNRNYGIEEF